MKFGKNVRYLRKKRNMSQDELADLLGYKSFTTIQKWESGDSEPNMNITKKIADIFHISIDELTNEDLEKFDKAVSNVKNNLSEMNHEFKTYSETQQPSERMRKIANGIVFQLLDKDGFTFSSDGIIDKYTDLYALTLDYLSRSQIHSEKISESEEGK